MATRIHAKACGVYVDEFDMTGVSNAVDAEVNGNLADLTAFEDTDMVYAEGKPTFTVTLNGLYSTAAPDWDSYSFSDLTATSRFLGVYPGGRTEGTRGFEYVTIISSTPRIATTNSAVAVNVTWQTENAAVARSIIQDIDTAVGATAGTTGYQMGAVGASELGVGTLRLLASPGGAGNNTLDVKIQSDDNSGFTSPTDRITFTQLDQDSTAKVEVLTVAGAVTDTYWRVYYTYAGAGSRTFSLVMTTGIRLA